MPALTPTIEVMLQDYSERLEVSLLKGAVGMKAMPLSDNPDVLDDQAQQCRELVRECEYYEEVTRAWKGLRDERRAAEQTLFAGVWPPTNPFESLAARSGLAADIDELPWSYFGGEDDGQTEHPLFWAFVEVDEALRTLEPNTVEAATAIFHAWKQDVAVDCGYTWDAKLVRRAKRRAMAELPRAR